MPETPRVHTEYDAIVVGGGPGGSACAMTLARAGRSVLLLERAVFPRFHVGESMVTYGADVMEQLGVLDKLKAAGFPVKRGVELSGTDGRSYRVDFQDIGEGYRNWTFQVERAAFDKILLDTAAEEGVEVIEDARVIAPLGSGDRVTGVRYAHGGAEHQATAAYVVDASGRAGVLARALGLRKTDESVRMVAVFKHYEDVNDVFNPGAKGDIQLGNHADGWVWGIPIRENKVSIGTVVPVDTMRRGNAEEIYEEYLDRVPRIKTRVQRARVLGELHGETDYSHYSEQLAGPGYFIVGDAGCFTDPIFSSGVFLAMVTGKRAAEAVDACLSEPASEQERGRAYESFYKTGFDTYHRLIRAFYANDYSVFHYLWEEFESGADYGSIVRLLNGDFWNEDNAVARRLREEPSFAVFENFTPDFTCPVHAGSRPLPEVAAARAG